MDHNVTMRLELEISAQKILSHLIVHNETVEKGIEAGLKNAFETFDFERVVTEAAKRAIQREIEDASGFKAIREMVRKKADEIVNKHIEKQLEELTKTLK